MDTPAPLNCVITKTSSDPTGAASVGYRIDFDRPVADFDVGDITLGGTISGTALTNFSGSGTTYTVDVTGLVGAGTVCIEVAAGVAHDSGGIANTASEASCYTVVGFAGDLDRDGDVDMSDFSVFQACFNGPNRPPGCAG